MSQRNARVLAIDQLESIAQEPYFSHTGVVGQVTHLD